MENEIPWHEQDFFWETAAPVMFTERRWANTPVEVDKLFSLLEIKQGAHILDLGCGVGRHSLELARRGFMVTGVDRTKRYLEQASEKAAQEGLDIEFVHEDMRTFCRPDTFDATLSMFTSFSYFEDPEEDRKVVMNVYQSLKQGGVFLLETHGKESLAPIFQESNWHEQNGILVLQEHKVTNNWSWMENRWIIIKDDKRTEFKVTHRLYAATEMVSLLTGCGFKHVDVFGDLAGSPYDHTARRLVVVAHK
jgi:SAM-dependent methyltransferase